MFVGVLRLTLHLPAPGSLKSKRHLVRSAVDRVKARYNVSIAEVAENVLWQRSVLGIAAVGNEHAFVNETLDKVAEFVTSMHGGQILVTGRDVEIVAYRDHLGAEGGRTLAEAEAERGEGGWERDGDEGADGEEEEDGEEDGDGGGAR